MVAHPLNVSTKILSGTSWLFIYTKLRFGPGTAKFAETDVGSWVVKGKVRERRILVNSVKRGTGWTHGDCNVLYNPLVVSWGVSTIGKSTRRFCASRNPENPLR